VTVSVSNCDLKNYFFSEM